MKTLNERFLGVVCASSAARPWWWLLATLLVSIPALVAVGDLRLDTDLIQLLPRSSRASVATRELQPVIGSDSYFALVVEGDRPAQLDAAVQDLVRRIERLDSVSSVEYRNPVEFIERYRYLLVPSYYLQRLSDLVLDWELEVNPFTIDLGDPDTGGSDGDTYGQEQDRKFIEEQLQRYADLPPFHQSTDGRLRGMIVRPRQGTTSLGATRRLFGRLEAIGREVASEHGVRVDVGGTLRNKVDEFNVIVDDLNRSGLIAGLAIVLVLVISFASVRVLPVLLLPLATGLLWAFALVPTVIGPLNTISVFMALVMFGMGIDYAIHLVKRFQLELTRSAPREALLTTYCSTGASVLVSGVTTALALAILGLSGFRGFSDFGILGAMATVMVLAAMLVVMPATMILGQRFRLVKPVPLSTRCPEPAGKVVTALLGVVVLAAAAVAWQGLSFDYDFSKLKADVPESQAIKERVGKVYATSGTPGAIFVAPDVASLDGTLAVLEAARQQPGSLIGRIASIRDFAPTPAQAQRRRELIEEIQEETRASWTQRIDDPDKKRWIAELNAWQWPEELPTIEQVPPVLRDAMQARDGSGAWLIGVFPNVPRSNGHNAIAFTRELYGLQLPAGVRGPAGETPVFGEILMLVTGESDWLVGVTFLGIFVMVLVYRRSLRGALWIMLPLVAGLALTLGVMAAFGLRLNFFNIVVIPALLGMGVDHGVHYYSRWQELHGARMKVHAELMAPLTVCTVTTMLGYSGMVFAAHQGLRSIGLAACIGLSCVWMTALVLLPGLLNLMPERTFEKH